MSACLGRLLLHVMLIIACCIARLMLTTGARAPLTRRNVLVEEKGREGVPMPEPTKNRKPSKLFVFLWIDHLGNRIYRATETIGTTPFRVQLWNPLVSEVRRT